MTSSYHTLISRLSPRVELPQEQYDPLRMELFKAIARFSSGARLVLLQLCRALVGLAFQTMPDVWPNTVVSCIHTLRSTTQAIPVSGEEGEGRGGGRGGGLRWSPCALCRDASQSGHNMKREIEPKIGKYELTTVVL